MPGEPVFRALVASAGLVNRLIERQEFLLQITLPPSISIDPPPTASVEVGGSSKRVDVRYIGTETIGTDDGNRRAIHIDGASYRARPNMGVESETPARTFSVWLSDDADRVPLKMLAHTELGDVTMDLTEYSRP